MVKIMITQTAYIKRAIILQKIGTATNVSSPDEFITVSTLSSINTNGQAVSLEGNICSTGLHKHASI
jgi:hypothetical protein